LCNDIHIDERPVRSFQITLEKKASTLQGMVDEWLSPKRDWVCDKRESQGTATAETTFITAYLILTVGFPYDSPHETKEEMFIGQDRYSLVGVVIHSGVRLWGHYVAVRKVEASWIEYNDNYVYQGQSLDLLLSKGVPTIYVFKRMMPHE